MRKIITILILCLSPVVAVAQEIKPNKEAVVYKDNELDSQPEYPGGMSEFYKFINSNMRIPELDHDLNAKFIVTFVIETDGSMSNFSVTQDPGYGIGDQALLVLKQIPEKWNPGKIKQAPVRYEYKLPMMVTYKS